MDDCLTGANNLEEATHTREALNHLLDKAQMTLRKWSIDLKANIPEGLLEKDEVQLISAPLSCHKALGVHWNTANDSLHIVTSTVEDIYLPTKSQVLSDVARTFNVLGWFSPVTVTLKILLQKIWQLGIEWAQYIPQDLADYWKTWRKELPLVTELPIYRYYYHHNKERLNIHLHGFCDSSLVAFAGVVYIQATYTDTSVSTTLVIAKSKVAPLKTQTIP